MAQGVSDDLQTDLSGLGRGNHNLFDSKRLVRGIGLHCWRK
jgi:hypothetical protein